MKLYFQRSNGELDFVKELASTDEAVSAALEDLKIRNPQYKTYYQRTWTDHNGWYWIDVGSWSEFYVVIPD